jgi:hypothetical protein
MCSYGLLAVNGYFYLSTEPIIYGLKLDFAVLKGL